MYSACGIPVHATNRFNWASRSPGGPEQHRVRAGRDPSEDAGGPAGQAGGGEEEAEARVSGEATRTHQVP